MRKITLRWGVLQHPRSTVATLATVRGFLFGLLLAALVAVASASAEVQRPPVVTIAPGLPFAIADFDGDLHPDLASVQLGIGDSTNTVYWIRLQLTAAGPQSIRVVAPVGGLQLLARDVNGDQAIDLVVMTAGLGEPVAVFLNDGHGGFSQADKNALSGSFSGSAQNLTSPDNALSGSAGIPPQTRIGISYKAQTLSILRPGASFLTPRNFGFPLDPALISHSTRAPPFQLFSN
jgi:hypothetical protein